MIIYGQQHAMMHSRISMINKQIPNIKHIEGLVMVHLKVFFLLQYQCNSIVEI